MAHRSWCAEVGGQPVQRAARVPRRRRARLGGRRPRLPAPRRPARGQADRPAQERGQRHGAGRGRRVASTSATCLLLGKGEDAAGGRQQAVDPVRRARGRARRGLPRRRRRARPRPSSSGCSASACDRRRRGSIGSTTRRVLQESTARLYDTAPVYVLTRVGPRPRQALLGDGAGRRRARSATARAVEEAGRAGGRRRGMRRALAGGSDVPELPEVETVRRGLVSFVVGRRIERVEVGRERTVRRTSRAGADRRADRGDDHRRSGAAASTSSAARHRRRADDPPADERAGAGRRPGAHRPRHTHVVLHLARGGARRRSCGSSIRARSARWSCSTPTTSRPRCPSWPSSASTRSPTASRVAELRRHPARSRHAR